MRLMQENKMPKGYQLTNVSPDQQALMSTVAALRWKVAELVLTTGGIQAPSTTTSTRLLTVCQDFWILICHAKLKQSFKSI